MLNNLLQADAIRVHNSYDIKSYTVSDEEFSALLENSGNLLLQEPCDMAMFDATYFYQTDIHPSQNLLLEAITTTRARVSQTMRAFIRSLNAGLQGTDITAGVVEESDVAGDSKVLGGAEIGKTRKSAGLAVLSARIPLSDGQSVTIVFHSPSGDAGKITAQDVLVAFRFYLNKRDVTHAVAPMGGRDISLKQTTMVLSNLIERNSAKFQKSRDKNAKLLAEISEQDALVTSLEEESARLTAQGDEILSQGGALDDDYDKYRSLADNQAEINAKLLIEIEKLENREFREVDNVLPQITDKTRQITQNLQMNGSHTLSNGAVIRLKVADKDGELVGEVIIEGPAGTIYRIDSPSSQGGAMQSTAKKLLKLYRDGKAEPYIVHADPPEAEPAQKVIPEPEPVPEPEPKPEPDPEPVDTAALIQPALDAIKRADNADEAATLQDIKQLIADLKNAHHLLNENGVLAEHEDQLNAAGENLGRLLQQIANRNKG